VNARFNPVIMVEVVESSKLAMGEKEKNILIGPYDIISNISWRFQNTGQDVEPQATTCLIIPTGLFRDIKLMLFSFYQGDPIAMNLYFLQQEPFLRMLRANLSGLVITNFKQLLNKAYCTRQGIFVFL
jgi:hypothetical protein